MKLKKHYLKKKEKIQKKYLKVLLKNLIFLIHIHNYFHQTKLKKLQFIN